MKLDSTLTLLFLGLIAVSVSVVIILPKQGKARIKSKAVNCKYRMKQIGTAIALYYSDSETKAFPKNPGAFDIYPEFLYTAETSEWMEMNLNSPYFFFKNETLEYTGSADAPMATNWEPVIHGDFHFYDVLWEDGHVSTVTKEEQAKLIQSTFYGLATKLIYDLSFRKNQVFQ